MGNVVSVTLPYLSEYRVVNTCLIKERFHIKAMKGLKTYSFFTDIETDPEPVLCNIRVE